MLAAPAVNLTAILPVTLALLTAVLATVLGFSVPRRAVAVIGVIGLLAALVADLLLWNQNLVTFAGSFRADNFAVGFSAVVLLAGILALLTSLDTPRDPDLRAPEFYAVLLYAVTGTMLLASAGDLIVLLIGFEVMSLSVYVLSAFQARDRSEEAGMKYFLLGSLASAVLIYGIALVFGATGSFSLDAIRTAMEADGFQNLALLGAGALLILIGFGFKVSWAPFHQWTPDVYTGAPIVVTQYMSVGIKAAAFAGLIRFFAGALPGLDAWMIPAELLIALTMLVGNLAALRQTNLKRMLAYSSVAQAGYIGLAVLANPATGWPAALFYLLAYTLMNAGAFAVVNALSVDEDGPSIESLGGLARRAPGLAVALAFFLLSLAGIPPLAGFFGKYLVFAAAANAGYYGLVVLGALTSAISMFYYLRPVALAFFRPTEASVSPRAGAGTRAVVVIGVIGVIVLGVLPNIAFNAIETVGRIVASR